MDVREFKTIHAKGKILFYYNIYIVKAAQVYPKDSFNQLII